MQPDDSYWRRPGDEDPRSDPAGEAGTRPAESGGPLPGVSYPGPPPTTPPPSGWRPPRVVHPAAPRPLPPQDHARIDDAEARARTVTQGIAIVAGAIFMVTLCTLCARLLF